LQSLQAPDFTLPDLEGKWHALSEYRGRKVLLVSWASW
jgi:peroxiredoxin